MLKGIIQFFLFCILMALVINMPDHPDAFELDVFWRIPLEIPLLALSLIVVPRTALKWLAGFYTVLFGTFLLLKLADIGTQAAFQRPFNPYLDVKMVADGWNVLSRSTGIWAGAFALVAGIGCFGALLALFSWVCRFPVNLKAGLIGRVRISLFAVSTALLLLMLSGKERDWPIAVEANAAPYLVGRVELIAHSAVDMRRFEAELAKADSLENRQNLMARVAGKDVILIFVESYGRSAIQDTRYAPLITSRLDAMEKQFDAAGYKAASRWVTSPTVGGLSWLAHGTLLSGLWIDSQARYDRLIMSERASLNRLFRKAGWQTIAAMPAITLDWPESAYFGYDRVYAAKDLGYRGQPFNWITMPDQYTLSAIQKLVRDPQPRRNVMVETALISSHAPWTPVAHMVDWKAVGDGQIFNAQASAGQSPAFVWADPNRIRDHYIRTIDYSLDAVSSYISGLGENAVFIVIGDHQPASVVTGPQASRDVPMHIITKDPALVQALGERGFQMGLRPKDGTDLGMDALRDLIVDVFSGPAL